MPQPLLVALLLCYPKMWWFCGCIIIKKKQVSVVWWFFTGYKTNLRLHYATVGCGNIKAAPYCFGMNLLVRVKLGYTPNFTFLGNLQVT